MAVKFQEGWQKTTGHENIRNRGDAARKAAQLAEKANSSSMKATGQPQKPQANQAAKKPVMQGKDVAQTHQKVRPETHDQASRMAHASKAAEQHVKVRDDARNLQTLQTKSTTPKGTETATRTAVATKAGPEQANVKTQDANQPQQPQVANQAAQAQTQVAKKPVEKGPELPKAKQPQKGKAKDGKKAAEGTKTQAQDAEGAARTGIIAHQAGIAGAQGMQGELETGRTGLDDVDEDEGAEEEKDHNASTFAKGSSSIRRKKKGLDQLLSGSPGESGSDEADADAIASVDVSAAMNPDELPDADPALHVFNEFDTTAKDTKYITEKGQLYIRLVEKRIMEIAKLDREIEGRIKDIFETTPLSKRVVGELKEDLKTADFVTSVYGGIIG
jgi:hypothetical protein